MKLTSDKTTLLSDDILQIANSPGHKKPELNRLCRDYSNPLLLHDKRPVLNISQDELVGIFNNNQNHFCLTPGQALRFGEFYRLPLPDLISLMIKAEWENLIFRVSGHSMNNIELSLESLLRNSELTDKYFRGFRPDTGKYLTLIRDTVQSTGNITYSLVDFLITELLPGRKFVCGTGQTGLHYSDMGNDELLILAEASASERAEYHTLKIRWLEKSSELDDFLFQLEQKKRFNLNTEDKYFSLFMKEEAEKAGLIFRIEKLRIVLTLMKEKPGSGLRELLTIAEERMKNSELNNNEIRNSIARSLNCISPESYGSSDTFTNEEFQNRYKKEVKSLLRKIWLLCHTDTCPGYDKLDQEKQKEIDELWLRSMSSTKEEQYSYSPSMLLYHLPNLDQIKGIYNRICTILGIDAENYETGNRLEFMIRTGTQMTGLLEFLRSEISQISFQLTNLELIQDEYTDETRAQKFRSALENISSHSDKLKSEIAELKASLRSLKNEILKEYKNAN